MKTNVTAKLNTLVKLAGVIALNLIVSSGAFAAVTTINFDNIAAGTVLGTQYSGVTFSNALVISSDSAFPAQSGTQLAFSEVGSLDISFNSSLGSIQKVSGYITSYSGSTVYAYSSSNVLIASGSLPPNSINALFSLTSSTSPIARIIIDGNGDLFTLDTLTYETAVVLPVCEAINQNLYNSLSAVALSNYKVAKTASSVRSALLLKISDFNKALQSDVSSSSLLKQLNAIRSSVDSALKSSTQKTSILKMIDDLIAKTKANIC